ncbi:MAG: hypothetical protein JRI44_08600, partial [Deltaproteobacteria bacterium]|nr:hypothetical protein [Deltaproteobacteria bacterium]
RPESEIIPWLLSEAKKEASLKDFFKEFIFKVLEMVTVDPFIRRWVDVHSKEFGIKDELFDLFLRVKGPKIFPLWGAKIFTLRYLERLSNSLRSRDGGDPYVNKLLKACNLEFSEKNMPYEFEIQEHMRDAECIVMGHTHGAKFVPLTSKVFYLNTGTWGKYMTQTISGDGFVSSRNLTFVIIYKEEEYKDRRFELWNVMDNKQ